MLKTAFYTHFYIPDTSGYIQAVLSPIYQKKNGVKPYLAGRQLLYDFLING